MRHDPFPAPQWIGRLAYGWALRLQRSRREAVIERRAVEAFWLLEHDPVITLGRRGGEVHPHAVDPVMRVERGGLATWHGPGQLVGYLVLDIAGRGQGVKATVHAMEEGIIRWLAERGIQARRRCGWPGVWVGEEKIAAVGIHVRRGVTLHGFALNVNPDLGAFEQIVPCGIADHGVTSVSALGGALRPVHAIASRVGDCVIRALVEGTPAASSGAGRARSATAFS